MKKRGTHTLLLALVVAVCSLTVFGQLTAQKEAQTNRPYLGVRVAQVHEPIRSVEGIDVESGVLVKHVLPDSPAKRANLQPFDVILSVNDTSISSVSELSQKIQSRSPGDSIKLTVVRNGKTRTVRTELVRYGSNEPIDEEQNELTDQEKMNKVLGKMDDVEETPRTVSDSTESSDRSPEQLRKKMKSFLQEHSSNQTGNERTDKNKRTASDEGKLQQLLDRVRKRLQKSLNTKLDSEQINKIVQEFRSLAEEVSQEKLRSKLNDLLQQMNDTLKKIDGNTGRKLKEWKASIEKRIQQQMSQVEDRIDQKMQKFETRLEQRMKKYSKKLTGKIDKLDRLTEELRQLKRNEKKKDKQKDKQKAEDTSYRPYLGIRPAMDPAGKGILIREVKSDSPADRAGLKKGDVIRKMNGEPLNNVNSLQKRFYRKEPGEEVKLVVEREGWTRTMTIKLGRKETEEEKQSSSESGSGADDTSLRKEMFSLKGSNQDVLQRGKRAMWLLDIYTDYEQGKYLQVVKKGVRRIMDKLKEQVQETPLRLKGRFTLQNEKSGNILLSLPLDQNLAETVHQIDRVITVLIGK